MKYKILGIVILVAIAIQFIPYGKDHSNPPVVAEPKWDSPKTKEMFGRACADCHSNETKWPWYSNIAPLSWLNQYDVDEGREHFNVSMWGVQKKNEGNEAKEEVEKGEMPPWFYVIAHPEAKFSETEIKEFMNGLVATFGEEDED
jgi:mono/diheme cytochrome c family protein